MTTPTTSRCLPPAGLRAWRDVVARPGRMKAGIAAAVPLRALPRISTPYPH